MRVSHYKAWFLPILSIGLAFLHGLFLYSASSGMDDVYITYWAAKSLSDFGTIVNYNGDFLEQGSSLLHVVILAILHKLSSIPLPVIGIYFSAIMGGLTLLFAWRLARFLEVKSAWFVVLFCAIFPYLVYWSVAGLETTLVAFIVILFIYSISKFLTESISPANFALTVLLIIAYITARPEAILIVLTFLAIVSGYFIGYNVILKSKFYGKIYFAKIAILIVTSLASFTLLSLWRYNYFGHIFPQPVYAKSSGINLERSIQGIEYILNHFWMPSLVILTILAIYTLYNTSQVNDSKRLTIIIIFSFIITTLAFIVTSGGDWMMGGRFFVPVLPLLVILGVYSATKLSISKVVLLFLLLTASIDTVKFFKDNWAVIPINRTESVYSQVLQDFNLAESDTLWPEKANREHLRDLPLVSMLDTVVERLLMTKKSLTIFSSQMGIIPFYTAQKYFKKIRFLDRFALTTSDFTDCSVTNKMHRGKFGLQMSIWYFIKFKFNKINTECGIKRPDIIYGLFRYQMLKWAEDMKKATIFDSFETSGYKIVYFQFGDITTGSWLRQRKKDSNQYIAVREDLLPLVGELNPPYYKWPVVKSGGKWSW